MSPVTSTEFETSPGRVPEVTDVEGARVPWLGGITVQTVGTSVSLEVAARVLRQLGANVTSGTTDGATSADIVLVDRIADRGGVRGVQRSSAAEYLGFVAANNTSIWVTASAFGLESTRSDAVASDLTLMASAGILAHSRIGAEWAPTVPPGTLGLKMTGYVMAVSALHAVHVRRATGAVLHVDVSAQGSVIATGLSLEMAHALSDCPDEGGSARYGAPSGFFGTRDGSIYVLVLEQHQWEAFRATLAPALADVRTLVDAREQADFVNAQLAAWAATRTAADCERVLQGAGVPCSQINTVDTLAARSAEAGRPVNVTGPDAPPLPALVREVATSATDGGSAIPLTDLRVLDAGHVLAVPLGAAWLGAMGASVSKLEDPARLDIYRRRGPFAGGRAGLNRSAYFNQLNSNKTALDLRVGEPDAHLDLGAFDVIVSNLTPRRARVVGVDTDRVLTTSAHSGRSTLTISSSGYGGTGDWAGYRAYGHNIHASAGLVAATRDARGDVGDMGTPWADPLTSVAIAAWVLAWALAPERTSSFGVDIAMAELTAAQLADVHGHDLETIYRAPDVGGDFFLRAAGDTTDLAISLRDADEVARFEMLVGHRLPPITCLGQLIELHIPDTDIADLADRLRAADLAAAVVQSAPELARDPVVRSTGLYQSVTSRALGEHDITGLPWHFTGHPHARIEAAPERPDA